MDQSQGSVPMQAFNRINIIDDPDETWDSNLIILASSDLVLVITQESFFYVNKTAFYQGSLNYRDWQKDPGEKVYIIEKTHSLFGQAFNVLPGMGPLRDYSIVSIRPILDKIYQIGLQGKPPPAPSEIAIVPSTVRWDRLFELPKPPWKFKSKWLKLRLGDDCSFVYFHKLGISLSIYQIDCLHTLAKQSKKPVAYIVDQKPPYILALPSLFQFANYLFVGPVVDTENLKLSLLCVQNGVLVNRDDIPPEKGRWSLVTEGGWLYQKSGSRTIDMSLNIAISTPEMNTVDEYNFSLLDATIQFEPWWEPYSVNLPTVEKVIETVSSSASNNLSNSKSTFLKWKEAKERKRMRDHTEISRNAKRKADKADSEQTTSEECAETSQEKVLKHNSNRITTVQVKAESDQILSSSSVVNEENMEEDLIKIKSEPIYDDSEDSVVFVEETTNLSALESGQTPIIYSIAGGIHEIQPEQIHPTPLGESIAENEENLPTVKEETIEEELSESDNFVSEISPQIVWIKQENSAPERQTVRILTEENHN